MTKTNPINVDDDPAQGIRTESKFAGEEFDGGNVRTVFASASKDNMERKDRVILLFGATGSDKSGLIDCMCNYFYGAKFDGTRYKIANEIFDRNSTPIKSVTKYVFNETVMPYRPVVIDTPEIASDDGLPTEATVASMLHDFLVQSHHIHINAIGLVLKFDIAQISISKEEQMTETTNLFPIHLLPCTIILFSLSDEKRPIPQSVKALLHHLNLNHNKYYFFNEHFQQINKESKQNDEKQRSSWDLTMSELDRFFEQLRRLNSRQITEKNIPINSIDNDMQYETTFTRYMPGKGFKKNTGSERIIPVKLIAPESEQEISSKVSYDMSTVMKDRNSPEAPLKTPVIKRYVYNPGMMAHKECVIKMKQEEVPVRKHVDVQNCSNISHPHSITLPLTPVQPVRETLINDIPAENIAMIKKPEHSGLTYRHVSSIPPPDYGTESVTVVQETPGDTRQGKAKVIEKRTSTTIDFDPQQQTTPQYPRSAVQRQIARRASSGTEPPKSHCVVGIPGAAAGVSATATMIRTGWVCPPQQEQSPKNIQIRQAEQVIERLEDGILSTRNSSQDNDSQILNGQEQESYVIPLEMKRSKSPIQVRLTMGKKQRHPSTDSSGAHGQPDDTIEQPRTFETNIDQNLQSPLRSCGRLVREDEEKCSQDGVLPLVEEVTATTTAPLQKPDYYDLLPNEMNSRHSGSPQYNAEAGKSSYGVNERDQLLGIGQLNLKQGLTLHPYRAKPRYSLGMNERRDGARRAPSVTIGKTTYSTWDWVNCCFFLLAPLFVLFVIIAIVITIALLA